MEETKEERVEFKIYQIVCKQTGEVYFGKTTESLKERLRRHCLSNNTCTSKQIIARGNYYIEQIDSTFGEEESIILERRYIETFECINIQVPGRTYSEWYQINKDKKSIQKKEYYVKNREKSLEHKKDYYVKNREKILEQKRQKYTCVCGTTLTIQKRVRHEKSQRHINFVNLNNNNI